MSNKHGPPKHQNCYAWKPNAGRKINETEVGGRFRPLSEITGVCQRCKEQIDWKRRYGKYKPLTEPAKCQKCTKRNVRQAYHNLCTACAKEQKVCTKCRCHVDNVVGRDLAEVEAEQKTLEDAIKNARERDRRAILRAMNKGQSKSSERTPTNEGNKVGDLFPTLLLEEYAAKSRDHKSTFHGKSDLDHDKGMEEDEAEEEDGDGDGGDGGGGGGGVGGDGDGDGDDEEEEGEIVKTGNRDENGDSDEDDKK